MLFLVEQALDYGSIFSSLDSVDSSGVGLPLLTNQPSCYVLGLGNREAGSTGAVLALVACLSRGCPRGAVWA